MSLESTNKVARLKDRALMFSKSRDFFAQRGICEVDVPILSQHAPVDLHIDLVTVSCLGKKGYLHSSPEYGMKRLLCEGMGDIYQLSHVFRDGERGERHHPEFVMAEWYRLGFTLEHMMEETLAFIRLFLDVPHEEIFSYEELFFKYKQCSYKEVESLDEVLAFDIEPHLGKDKLTVIKDFPKEQAALSKTRWNGKEEVAERFEVFYQGIELANGYNELLNGDEQLLRLQQANDKRSLLNKATYPIDHHLIAALKKGMPECCGVAVGFDRLMMLRHKALKIDEIIPYCWEET